MSKKKDILYVVVPCYNEEEVLNVTTTKLTEKIKKMINDNLIDSKSKIMFVNDGSKDSTWEIMQKLNKTNRYVTAVNLSRNRGHQNALLAGLMTAKEYADMVISMDADLQDDINVMDKMVQDYYLGKDIVYGVRSSRKKDTLFKRKTAEGFYKFMKHLGVDIVYNHADYRLMSKRALNELERFKEVNLFLRGIIPLIGFDTSVVTYERNERFAGESKYPLKKMLSFAFEGILSFSVKPIKMIITFGIFIVFFSIASLLYVLINYLVTSHFKEMTTILLVIALFSGIQTIFIGIIGQYVGKTYSETKQRPRFIIEKVLLND